MKVVIIGGGFAGVNLAKGLAKDKRFEVILVDRNNYNFFPPLIYQVATGFLEPSSISYPFRKLFYDKLNIQFRLGEVKSVVPAENKVTLSNGELTYDQLVFATGAETNYFGMENVMKNAIPMKTLEDAIEMRNKLLQQIEDASILKDPVEVKKLLTFVVAGGGPTGVEISGMFAEMRKNVFRKEYPELAGKGGDIYLIDGSPALLSPMSVKSQQDTFDALSKLGVRIKLDTTVKDFDGDSVQLSTGETIPTKNLIWAAGVTAKSFEGLPQDAYGRGKRLLVDEFNRLKDYPSIYAIGDTCFQTTDKNFPNGHPQVAQVAIQQGVLLAKNFRRILAGESLKPFSYFDKGSMAIIGRNKAVADLPKPKMHFKGFIAWLIWLFIHLLYLITFRNKVRTFYNWMIAYFTKNQSLRMIIKPSRRGT